MTKNKFYLILAIIIFAFIIFSIVLVVGFNLIKNNPIDAVAMTYIRNNEATINQYGKIISIGRNIINKTEKSDNLMNVPYTIETASETTSYRIIAYVKFQNINGNWKVISMEVKEVIENTY